MFASRVIPSVLVCAALQAIAGCGGSSNCAAVGLNVAPSSATLDHTAAAPANSQMFSTTTLFGGGNGVCTGNAAALVSSNWMVSDPSVHLSAAQGPQITATCTAAVASPVTITATAVDGQMLTGQASLTCK